MKDNFELDEEDRELSEDELIEKLALRMVTKLHPVVAKKKLFELEKWKLKYNYQYFKREYEIFLKGQHITRIDE